MNKDDFKEHILPPDKDNPYWFYTGPWPKMNKLQKEIKEKNDG